MTAPATVFLPCGHTATHEEIMRLAGQISSSRRKTHGAGPGRPRTAQRCPCGAMTAARAIQRRHKCESPYAILPSG